MASQAIYKASAANGASADFHSSLNSVETVPALFKTRLIPGVNGLRALAIITVLISHLRLTESTPSAVKFLGEKIFWGDFGVQIFFVISGFLITGLLLKEMVLFKRIDFTKFFLRRLIRIFPVFYVYLLAVALISHIYNLHLSLDLFLSAALYLQNFELTGTWLTGHSWSLAVEEQFYILWPAVLSHFLAKLHYVLWLVGAYVIFIYPFIAQNRILLIATLGPFLKYTPPILCGALLAVTLFKNLDVHLQKHRNWFGYGIFVAWLSLLPGHLNIPNAFTFRLSYIVSSVLITLFVYYIITLKPEAIAYKIFNHQAANLIGTLSYSLYIWQQIFLIPFGTYPNMHVVWNTFPFNILALVIVAYISFIFVEKPFLKLKDRYSFYPKHNNVLRD